MIGLSLITAEWNIEGTGQQNVKKPPTQSPLSRLLRGSEGFMETPRYGFLSPINTKLLLSAKGWVLLVDDFCFFLIKTMFVIYLLFTTQCMLCISSSTNQYGWGGRVVSVCACTAFSGNHIWPLLKISFPPSTSSVKLPQGKCWIKKQFIHYLNILLDEMSSFDFPFTN